MSVRTVSVNLALVLLVATVVVAVVADQRDKAATRPASESRVTRYRLDQARREAKALNRILMVEFGADWCEDCTVLARNLDDPAIRDYFRSHFLLLRVDIGRSDRNLDVAKSLGLRIDRGIPMAIFYAADGRLIGATNNGELEPSRTYTAPEILAFLKAVAERNSIVAPSVFSVSSR